VNPSPQISAPTGPQGWLKHVGGLAGGLGFTLAILAMLAFAPQTGHPPEETEIEEVRAIEIPEPPPPPPPNPNRGTPLPPAPIVFEEAPSTSSVRIAPTPIPNAPLVTVARPAYSLHFDFTPGEFRPDSGDWEPDVNHVFQRSEVDQQVVAIYKKVPNIPAELLKIVQNPRVRVLMVVNTDGSVENVRVLHGTNADFDALVADAIRGWRFRPAMKKGKKVRCLVELPVYVKAPSVNRFMTN
jgi:TonB family protein